MELNIRDKRGQAITELAIFGSIILVLFGVLLSYLQRMNDQQYVQMEVFRRALHKACTYTRPTALKPEGASVQYTLVTDRRHADLSGNLGKGSSTTMSASTNVFWAVPKVGSGSESLIAFKINEDEMVRNYRDFVPQEHEDDWSFSTEEMDSSSASTYSESATRAETTDGIVNDKSSVLQETKTVTLPYRITKKDSDDDDENDEEVKSGTFWEGEDYPEGKLEQRLYRDTDGQYKYSETAPEDARIERSRKWETEF